jgi:hypothetical protein
LAAPSPPRRTRPALRALVLLRSLVPLSAGLAGALLGPGFARGAAAAESHGRYLSGLLLGLGRLAAWCAVDLRGRGALFDALGFVVAVGGLACLLGVALAKELVVLPALALGRRRVFSGGR